jgi:hypothetical protein
MPDIDIDTQSTFNTQDVFKHSVAASMVRDGKLVKHPVGTYFQQIPVDPITKLAAIPYSEAEEIGYFKVDFLHLYLLDYFENKKQIRVLLRKSPNWNLLKIPSVVGKLFQLSNHYDVVSKVSPQSIDELADCLALIRPSKLYLLDKYTTADFESRDILRKELYAKPKNDKAWFKRAHAIAYAHNIILQMHLIDAGIDI